MMHMVIVRLFEPYLKKMDLICGLIGLLLGLIIVLLSAYGVINQITIGLAILCISSIYVFIRPKIRSQQEIVPITFSRPLLSLMNIVFWSLLSVVLLVWHFNQYHRPVSYFFIVSIMAAIIALELFSSDDSRRFWPIFVKIVVLSLVFRGGIFFNYPSIMGYDAFFHIKIVDSIMLTGSVPPFEISDKYVYAPIVHILIASVGMLCQVSAKNAIYLSIGIASVVITLFLYLIGKNVAGPGIGLLSVLLVNFTNDLIVRGITNVTPDSLVICYLMIMLYLFFTDTVHINLRDSLLVFFSFLLVITHQLSTFVVFLILIILISSQAAMSYVTGIHTQRSRSIVYLTLFGIAIVSYWINMQFPGGSTFFSNVLGPFIDVLRLGGDYGSDLLIVGHAYERPVFDLLILHFSYLILPFFGIGGLLLWMSPENRKRFLISIVAVALFGMVYGIPLLGIRNLLTSRWMPILGIFLAVLAAAFIYQIINLMSSRTVKLCSIFLIIFVFAFLMIITPEINKDNPLIGKNTTVRDQFTFSELQAAGTIGSKFEGDVFVDSLYSVAYTTYGDPHPQLPDGEIKLPKVQSYDISIRNDPIEANSIFILRTSALYEPILVKASDLYGDMITQVIPQNFFDSFESNHYDLVYDSGYILGYLSH